MHKLLARDHREMPWKNGGGTTTEIATSPAGSSLDEFGWRVSMARVAQPGPFSRFPGVDRSIALVSGEGMTLAIAGRGAVEMDARTAPLAFPGDVDVHATRVAGPVTDFNVMTRRGTYRHLMTRIDAHPPARLAPLGSTAILVVVTGAVRVSGESEPLGPLDTLVLGEGESAAIACAPGAAGLVVDLWRC